MSVLGRKDLYSEWWKMLLTFDPKPNDDVELRDCHELHHEELVAQWDRFGVRCDPSMHPVTMMPWQSGRDAPFLNHAGLELLLMLEGRKLLVKILGRLSSGWLDKLLGTFDPLVRKGELFRRIVRRPLENARADGSSVQELGRCILRCPGRNGGSTHTFF